MALAQTLDHGIGTERQMQFGHPAAEQMGGVEITADGFVGVRRNLLVAKVERMMAGVGPEKSLSLRASAASKNWLSESSV